MISKQTQTNMEYVFQRMKEKFLLDNKGRVYFIDSWSWKDIETEVKLSRKERKATGQSTKKETKYILDKIEFKDGENINTTFCNYYSHDTTGHYFLYNELADRILEDRKRFEFMKQELEGHGYFIKENSVALKRKEKLDNIENDKKDRL